MSKIIFFILIIVAVAIEAASDALFRKWAIDGKNVFLIIGLTSYMVGTVFWAISLRHEYLSKAISVFTILNLIFIVLIGVFFFKENLSLLNKIGIVLGILSLFLVELG